MLQVFNEIEKKKLYIKEFTVEYKNGGIGLDVKPPVFSWKLVSDKQNTVQCSYRLRLSCAGTVFDTGVIEDRRSVFVACPIDGELIPKTEYRAEVEVTDNHGDKASASLAFETGLSSGGAFNGSFIAPDIDEQPPISVIGTSFTVNKEVRKARLYATALGMYKAEINGKKAGDLFFAPGWTSYNNILQYQTYDVTNLIAQGGNEISLTVAKGWYRGIIGSANNVYGDTSAVLAELHIFYADGTKDIIVTDKTWRAAYGYITDSEIYHGETQDFTRDLSAMYPVKEIKYDKNKIVAQMSEPCRITERLKPVKYFITPLGERVLDFGQNISGFVEFKINGTRGQTIELRHAEVLDRAGNFYTANLRSAKCTDTFVLSGGEQTLHAEFTFHGFRYLKITGMDEIQPNDFTALVIHSDLKKTGEITTSDLEINRLLLNVEWGQRDNFIDVPLDCPQRDERLGWTGDANVFLRTAAYQYNIALFFKKWLKDLAFDQNANGSVPRVIPDVLGNAKFQALWSDAATMIPYNLYKIYGDIRFLEEQYPSMKAFVEGLQSQCDEAGLVVRGHQYGDWLALDKDEFMDDLVGRTDVYYIANIFQIISLRIMVETAEILNRRADANIFKKRLKKVHKAFLKEYMTVTGRLTSDTQTASVLALHFDIVPKQYRDKVVASLKSNLEKNNGRMTTGFIGTPFLCFALFDNGLREECEKILLNREYPGWLYPVTCGATTIWERWNGIMQNGELYDPCMNSFNHYAYGSVSEFYYRRIVGIDYVEPGYRKIRIAPHFIKGIDHVRGEYESVYGTIVSGYEVKDGKAIIAVEIPANTTAEIVLPGKAEIINVGSGKYSYEI